LADPRNVRFPPHSDEIADVAGCPKRAIRDRIYVSTHRSKRRLLFDDFDGAQQDLRLIKLWAAY
jgi:hypothetical protein